MSERNGDYCQKCGAPVNPTDEKCPNGHILAEVKRASRRSAPAKLKLEAEARALIHLPGIPEDYKDKILEQMDRPEGTFGFIGKYDKLWDESEEKGILLQIIAGKNIYKLERDENFNINFYFESPGTGVRLATVDAKPLKGISPLQYIFTWSPEKIRLYISSLEGEQIFLESTSRKAEISHIIGDYAFDGSISGVDIRP